MVCVYVCVWEVWLETSVPTLPGPSSSSTTSGRIDPFLITTHHVQIRISTIRKLKSNFVTKTSRGDGDKLVSFIPLPRYFFKPSQGGYASYLIPLTDCNPPPPLSPRCSTLVRLLPPHCRPVSSHTGCVHRSVDRCISKCFCNVVILFNTKRKSFNTFRSVRIDMVFINTLHGYNVPFQDSQKGMKEKVSGILLCLVITKSQSSYYCSFKKE